MANDNEYEYNDIRGNGRISSKHNSQLQSEYTGGCDLTSNQKKVIPQRVSYTQFLKK